VYLHSIKKIVRTNPWFVLSVLFIPIREAGVEESVHLGYGLDDPGLYPGGVGTFLSSGT